MKRVKLTSKKLRDEDALGAAIDRVILSSRKSRTLTRKVLRAQRRLRRAVDDRAWQLYMALEEAVNARALWEGDRLVGWAFHEGRRRRR